MTINALSVPRLDGKLPLEDQIDLVARGGQEKVFFHLEALPRCLGGSNDLVLAENRTDMQSQLQVCEIHASATAKLDTDS
jgi:hypothetical protein